MVMMTVTPADARVDRMSTTLDALLLSRPAIQNTSGERKINPQRTEKKGGRERQAAQKRQSIKERERDKQHEQDVVRENQRRGNSFRGLRTQGSCRVIRRVSHRPK